MPPSEHGVFGGIAFAGFPLAVAPYGRTHLTTKPRPMSTHTRSTTINCCRYATSAKDYSFYNDGGFGGGGGGAYGGGGGGGYTGGGAGLYSYAYSYVTRRGIT
jgi:hypothetical protein